MKNKKKREERKRTSGITLIALVITVIVLLLLAGVSIAMLTDNNGILGRASEAKELTNSADIKERVNIAVIKALSKSDGEIEEENLKNALKDNLSEEYEIEGDEEEGWWLEVEKNKYTITPDGIIEDGFLGWKQIDEETMEKADGSKKLKIGEYVDYDPLDGAKNMSITSLEKDNGYGNQTFNLTSYTGKWQVLGVEKRKLKIVSEDLIKTDTEGNDGFFALKGEKGYENAVSELDRICELYGQGKGAVGARSIKIEDVNKITGYNPECIGIKNPTDEQIKEGTKANPGTSKVSEYGTELTYYWNEDNNNVKYEYYDDDGKNTNFINSAYDIGFQWFENGKFHYNKDKKSTEILCKLRNVRYSYRLRTLKGRDEIVSNELPFEYLKMLKGSTPEERYYFSSICWGMNPNGVDLEFSIRELGNGNGEPEVGYTTISNSHIYLDGNQRAMKDCIRPVIILDI